MQVERIDYHDDEFRAAVRLGIEQANRGELIDEEEMAERFQELLNS